MYIYKNQNGNGWYTTCKSKDMNGQEIKCYMSVQFKKGCEPSGTSVNIEIDDAFFSCYQSRSGVQPKLVIMTWRESVNAPQPKANLNLDDELPF